MRKTRFKPVIACLYHIAILFFLWACQQSQHQSETNDPELTSQWTRLGPGGGGSTFIPTFSYLDPNTFLVRCDMTGAYLTHDGGETYSIVNFPGGSSAFAFDPVSPLTMYIGSKTLNRSVDGGKSWETVFPHPEEIQQERYRGDHADYRFVTSDKTILDDLGASSIKNIKVDPGDSNTIYFSVGDTFYYTQDGGTTWSSIQVDGEIDYIYTNREDLSSQILVFTDAGLFKIGKADWQYTSQAFPENMKSPFSFTAGTDQSGKSIIYGLSNDASMRTHGGEAGTTVWLSNDGGQTWQQIENKLLLNLKNGLPTYSKISTSEYNASIVYLVASSYKEAAKDDQVAHWYGTLKTTDGGRSWRWVWKGGGGSGRYAVKDGQDAGNLTDAWVKQAFGGEYVRIIDVGVAPTDGDLAIVTDWYRTMKTANGGESWQGIYSNQQSDNSYISRGLDVTTAYGVHFDPHDPDHIAISYTDIGYHHSYNGGLSWFRSTDGIPPEWHNTCYWLVFDPEIKDKIWSVWSGLHDFPRGKMTRNPAWTQYGKGGVAISLDGGKSWQPSVEGMGFDSPSASIVLDPQSPADSRTLYVAAYGKGVFKSVDGGMSWELRNAGISGSLAAFELTILPDGTLYLITSPTPQHRNGETGREVFMGAVYKSTDGAETWEKLNPGDKVLFPNGLTYDPNDPDRLYLGSWGDIQLSDLIGGGVAAETGGNKWYDLDGGIQMSDDGGVTWKQIFDADHYVYDVTVDPDHAGRLYCNTFDRGAYRSDDGGQTWQKLSGYDFHWGHRVIPDQHDESKVYLTTFGSSIWHGIPEVDK